MKCRTLSRTAWPAITSRQRRMKVAVQFISAFNGRDWARMEAMLAPEFRHIDTVGTVIHGRLPYIAANRRMVDLAPDLAVSIPAIEFARGAINVRGTLRSMVADIDEPTLWHVEFEGDCLSELRAARPGNALPLSKMVPAEMRS